MTVDSCDLCHRDIDMAEETCVVFPQSERMRCLRCHLESERAITASLVFCEPERKSIHLERLKRHQQARIVRPPRMCCVII